MKKFILPIEELERISEYVQQGIVASKQTESEHFGIFKEKLEKNGIVLAVIQTEIGYVKSEIVAIKELIQEQYVTKEEFGPIKKLVYGMVGLILTGVMVGILALILKQ